MKPVNKKLIKYVPSLRFIIDTRRLVSIYEFIHSVGL